MEILDHTISSQQVVKRPAYLIYSILLVPCLIGPLLLVKVGLLPRHLLMDRLPGVVSWVGLLFVLTAVFYWKIRGTWGAILTAIVAFVLSFFVTGYFVDNLIDISPDEPVKAGLLMYATHLLVTLLIAYLYDQLHSPPKIAKQF